MTKPEGFPFHLVFTDTQGRECGYGFYRTLDAAVALLEHNIGSPFAATPAIEVDRAAGSATATSPGIGVWEVR